MDCASKTAGRNGGLVEHVSHQGIRESRGAIRTLGVLRLESTVLHRVRLSKGHKLESKRKKKSGLAGRLNLPKHPNASTDLIRQRAVERKRSWEGSQNARPSTIKRINAPSSSFPATSTSSYSSTPAGFRKGHTHGRRNMTSQPLNVRIVESFVWFSTRKYLL
jgi:hypothetical protein